MDPKPTARTIAATFCAYQCDVTDEDGACSRRIWRPLRASSASAVWPLREIVNGIFFLMSLGFP